MPKSQFIDPKEMRKAGEITFTPIPVNQYKKTIKDELKEKNFTKEDLKRIYHDMVVIREFETMLQLVKTTGGYNGVEYNNPGPAHLSAGQEAAAVGMAYMLNVNDFIFGSHRSHGEILAKGLRAIQLLDDKELEKIMNEFWDGATLNVAKKAFKGGTVKELGIRFLLYGALAEIFARTTGFNKGLGGSMHTFFTPFGIYPNNAIVGGSGSIAVGAALYKKVNRKPGIVVANLGDASMARGPVWEGMTFAAMDQFKKLWADDMKGGLPVIINIMDNQYGMGGQTRGETMGFDFAARIGAGVNPEQMHAERVDGYNPLAVIDCYRRKKAILEEKKDNYAAANFSEGHYLQVEVAARTAASKQPELAQKFLQFMVSPAFQNAIPTGNWMYPVANVTLPAGFEKLTKPATTLEFTPAEVAAQRQAWISEWQRAVSR